MTAYNGKHWVTEQKKEEKEKEETSSIFKVMRKRYSKNGGSEAFLLSQLWNHWHKKERGNRPFRLDFYGSHDPEWDESDLLFRYVEAHHETPPGNLRLEKCAAEPNLRIKKGDTIWRPYEVSRERYHLVEYKCTGQDKGNELDWIKTGEISRSFASLKEARATVKKSDHFRKLKLVVLLID